ncbi:uncharacterized protein LOC115442740 [Manduca sexta]|uniref:uncharacterized protein LOC115442740 n=1 Tax=Manduca sexta TaxID=7130 RepID=UPI0011841866|nr:uncharacterized protein LOC115442740 [Manduca sexta]
MNNPNKIIDKEGKEKNAIPTASTRGKRANLVRPRTPVRAPIVESDTVDSDGSYMSLASTASDVARTRKRGRPPTKANILPKPKRQTVTEKQSAEEMTTETDTEGENPSVASVSGIIKRTLPNLDELSQIVQSQPSDQLGDCIKEHLETLEKAMEKTRSLKCENGHELKKAMHWLKATTEELTRRSTLDIKRLENEIVVLRSQLSNLTTEICKLGGQVSMTSVRSVSGQSNEGARPAPYPLSLKKSNAEERLMAQVKTLVKSQFAALKAEIFPDRFPSPSLGKETTATMQQSQAQAMQVEKNGRKKKNARKAGPIHPPVEDLPPVARSEPLTTTPLEQTWETVGKSKPKKPTSKKKKKGKATKKETAAVTITVVDGSPTSYATITEQAKAKISLSDLGIEDARFKRTLTGGLLVAVQGPECGAKAERLAVRMREVLSDQNVRVNRPTKTGEIRLKDLDDAVTLKEVAIAVANAGGCLIEDIKTGEIRRTNTSMGTCWVRCPLTAVQRIAAGKRIHIGWGTVRVDILEARPLHCYRCLEKGHVGVKCPNNVDRSKRCYACSELGHKANQCTAEALKCPLCVDFECPSDHRFGKKCGLAAKTSGSKKQAPSAQSQTITEETMDTAHSQP